MALRLQETMKVVSMCYIYFVSQLSVFLNLNSVSGVIHGHSIEKKIPLLGTQAMLTLQVSLQNTVIPAELCLYKDINDAFVLIMCFFLFFLNGPWVWKVNLIELKAPINHIVINVYE